MARRILPAALLLALLVLPTTGFSQVTKTKDGYLLRMQWKTGDVYSYDVDNIVEVTPGAPIRFSADYSLTVLSIEDMVTTVRFNIIDPVSQKPIEETVQFDDRGSVGEESSVSSQIGFQYPKKPLKIGDSWEDEQMTVIMNAEVKVLKKYKFEGLEIVKKVPCFKLSVTSSARMSDQMEMSIETTGVIYIENRTGQLFQSTMEMTIVIDPDGSAMKIPNKTVIKRK